MKKITKKAKKEFVKMKLSTSEKWAKTALLKIFDFQTGEEQESHCTRNLNGVGFTSIDGDILSSFAKQLENKGYLSGKQMAIVYRKMPKYWKQIIGISDEEKLNKLILKNV